ncbi:MAG: hypothetical protein ABW224_20695 [Kibdelosporangium sp.]
MARVSARPRSASILVMVLAALLTVLAAGTAHAHGGPIKLEVSSDGGQGVNATVSYKNDGHMVTDEVKLSYTAVAADGQTAGPVRMIASAEGQAFYVSEKPLPVGKWTVTVTATQPSPAQQTVAVTSAALPAAATTSAATDSSNLPVTLIIVFLAAAAVLGATAFLLRRRALRRA